MCYFGVLCVVFLASYTSIFGGRRAFSRSGEGLKKGVLRGVAENIDLTSECRTSESIIISCVSYSVQLDFPWARRPEGQNNNQRGTPFARL